MMINNNNNNVAIGNRMKRFALLSFAIILLLGLFSSVATADADATAKDVIMNEDIIKTAQGGGGASSSSSGGVGSIENPTLHILYCASWGMKTNYIKVRQFLESSFPELRGNITGGNYPPPPVFELLQNILMIMQMFAFAWMVFGGEKLLRFFGFTSPPQPYYNYVQENGFQCGLIIFIIIPQLCSSFLITGAFEVYLNETQLIYSKLENGALPKVGDLIIPLTKAGLKHMAGSAAGAGAGAGAGTLSA